MYLTHSVCFLFFNKNGRRLSFFHQLQTNLKEAEEQEKQLSFEKKSLQKGLHCLLIKIIMSYLSIREKQLDFRIQLLTSCYTQQQLVRNIWLSLQLGKMKRILCSDWLLKWAKWVILPGRGGDVLGMLLASQNPYPTLVYPVAKYRSHLSHFLENVIFTIPTL